jgi:acetylornithine/succinyldiaminopimelate/putrescine aminotransferase
VERGDRAGYLKALEDDACGVLFEPVQGEGGVFPFERDFLDFVCKEAAEREVVVICDEIQSGMGRTGTFFAFEQFGIVPQVITMAKGIANGLPLGVVAAVEEVASTFTPGSHGSTFGGNPVSCAAAVEVVRKVREPGFLENVAGKGRHLRENLEALMRDIPEIVSVRGIGLMLGVVFSSPCKNLVDKCLEKGLIVNCTEETVLRLLPPLTVEGDEIDEAVGILRSVLEEGVS